MGHRPAPALLHGKPWLGPIQCLDLALFVHGKHNRVLRRVQVKSDDIDQLLFGAGIVAQLEGLDSVRLKPMLYPDRSDCGRPNPHDLRHAPGAPVASLLRRFLDRLSNYFRTHGRNNPSLPTPPRFLDLNAFETSGEPTTLSFSNRLEVAAQDLSDLPLGASLGCE
jgi:hypothetical protein